MIEYKYTIKKIGRWGKIEPIPKGKLAITLDRAMKYEKQGIEFMANKLWGIIRLYKKKKGIFPWGFKTIVADIMHQWKQYSGEIYIIDTGDIINKEDILFSFACMKNLRFNDKQLRNYQKETNYALAKNRGGIVSLPTGSGKTRLTVEYIKQFDVDTLVVVHTIDLKEQWKNAVKDIDKCNVITYQSIKDKKLLDKYELVIFDECHHVSAKLLYNVAMNCPNAQLVGLSATPYREDGEEMKIQAALGNIIYKKERKELIEKGYLVPAKVYYHEVIPDTVKWFVNYHDAYESYIVMNSQRNNIILDITSQYANKNKKILILVNRLKHGAYLFNVLDELRDDVVFMHGQLYKKERKERIDKINKDKFNIIIATTIFDEGIDIPNLDVLILAAGGKSSIKLTQRVGRLLRLFEGKKEAIIHDFKDDCKWLGKHYKRRRRLLEKEFKVIDYGQEQKTLLS